jgi:hypothetical protein
MSFEMDFIMITDKRFPLTLKFEGQHYKGRITPSEQAGKNGLPVYFRVELGGRLFAYLCCSDNGWQEKEPGDKPKGLINAIGEYIKDFYK